MAEHDELCPQRFQYPGHKSRCVCALLRQARADERAKATECGICYALVARDSLSSHVEWHSERGDYS